MSYETTAKKIPDQVRGERLLVPADPIRNAVPVSTNKHMQLLFAIWYEFVEPYGQGDIGCQVCVKGILNNFRELKPTLMEMEREYNILKALRQ